jgi:hypothetical protein
MTRSNALLLLLSAIVLLQSALLWKLCAMHRDMLADVACVPLVIDGGNVDSFQRKPEDNRGGPVL